MDGHDPHCRIGTVRFKTGLTLYQPLLDEPHENHRHALVANAQEMATMMDSNQDGYFMVSWNRKGRYVRAWRADPNGMSLMVLPHYISEIVRREVITYSEIMSVLDE